MGRPNAGKTTLTNALVGEKVGIVSNRPQTTRHAIRGVVHRPAGQIVLVDTPGLHKPKSLLGKRLNDVVRDTLSDVDVIVFCIPADQPVGTGDAFIARQLREVKAPIVLVVTKTDAARKKQITEQLVAASKLVDAAEVVPVSAVAGDQVELLEDLLIGLLPEGPPLYPEEQTTDEDTERQIAELIREAALEKVRQEVPHSLAVTDRGDDPPARPEAAGRRAGRGARAAARRAEQPEADAAGQGRVDHQGDRQRGPRRHGDAARRPGAPGAARHGAGRVAGRPEEAATGWATE